LNAFEPLAYKIAEANRRREHIRGRAEGNGVTVQVDADGRTVELRIEAEAGYLSLDQLATLIVDLSREAQRHAGVATEEVLRDVRDDPMAVRVATFTEAAIEFNPARPQRILTEEEMAAAQAARITRQLRSRLPNSDPHIPEPKGPSHR